MLDFANWNAGFLSSLTSNSLRARPRKGGHFDSAAGIPLRLHGTLRLDFANPSPLRVLQEIPSVETSPISG
jgi:hypothetical protein